MYIFTYDIIIRYRIRYIDFQVYVFNVEQPDVVAERLGHPLPVTDTMKSILDRVQMVKKHLQNEHVLHNYRARTGLLMGPFTIINFSIAVQTLYCREWY